MTHEMPPETLENKGETVSPETAEQKIEEIHHLAIEEKRSLNETEKAKIEDLKKSLREINEEAAVTTEESKGLSATPKEHRGKSWFKTVATLFGFAGAMAIPKHSGAKTPEDTLTLKKNTTSVSKETPKDSAKKNTASFIEGAKESLPIRPVTAQERKDWNAFLDFVEAEGYKGSKELDKGSDKLARSLFAKYKKLHPATTLDYSMVASVQADMQKLRENIRDFAKRHNDPMAAKIMENISDVDGWFGSETSEYGYPGVVFEEYHNDNLIRSEQLGLMDSNMNAEKNVLKKQIKKVPQGVKIEHLSGGDYYEDPETGDLVRVK